MNGHVTIDAVKSVLEAEGYICDIVTGIKTNVTKRGLSIRIPGSSIAPTIYEDDFDKFRSISEVRDIILMELRKSEKISSPDVISIITDYERIKPRLRIRLVNYKLNRNKGIVIKPYLDMGIIPYINMRDIVSDESGKVIEEVTEELLERWGKTVDEVISDARRNGDDFEAMSMEQVFAKMLGIEVNMLPDLIANDPDFYIPDVNMTIVTNKDMLFGAAVLSDINAVYNIFGDKDMYIMPSSVHEVIAVPADDLFDTDTLREMVYTVNATDVPVEDFLSNSVYLYDSSAMEIRIA
jgi:hypothetical protein